MAALEKHYVIFIEELLFNRNFFDINIENFKRIINDLDNNTIVSVPTDLMPISETNCTSDSTLSKVVEKEDARINLEIEIYRATRLKDLLITTINNLSPLHQQIIELRYTYKFKWEEVAEKLFFDTNTIRKYRNEAIKSIAFALWGTSLLRESDTTLFDFIDM